MLEQGAWMLHVLKMCVPLIDWISDTLSQGYTNLQSLVKCLDHRGIAWIQYAVKQGCVRLCNALKCFSEAIVTDKESVCCSGAQHSTEHSPGVSLNTHFQLSGSSLLDESDNGSADEEEVCSNGRA